MKLSVLPLFQPYEAPSDLARTRREITSRHALALLTVVSFFTWTALLAYLRSVPEQQVVDPVQPSNWCANAFSSLPNLLPVSSFLLLISSLIPGLSSPSSLSITLRSSAHLVPDVTQTPIADPDTELAMPTWENLRPGEHCLRYATREYTARLANAPNGADGFRACKSTPVVIHGREMHPTFCQDLGFGRGVWGFWSIDFDEPGCETRWGRFTDLGCEDNLIASDDTAPVRRIESRLKNLQPGSNWQIMCVTTPADIAGQHFATPAECMNAGQNGIFGLWDVQDGSCD